MKNMSKRIIAFLMSSIIVIISNVPAFAVTSKSPLLNYTFESTEATPTLYGNATTQYDSDRDSNVLILDGSDNTYAEIPQGFFDGKDSITISMDVKPQTDSGNFFTFVIGKDNTYYNFLRIRGSEIRNAITVNSYTQEKDVKTNSATTDSWMNLTLVIDGVKSALYINGALKAVTEDTGLKLSDLGTDLLSYIGKSLYDGDAYYKGCFDNFQIYDYALTDAEIKDIFNDTIDLYPLLSNVIIGTEPDISNINTDSHTSVYSSINDGVITSYVRNSVVSSIPVTFSVLNDDVSITVDGEEFINGSRLNLSNDKQVVFSCGEKSESYLLKTPQIAVNSVLPGQYADPDIDYFYGKYWIFPTTDGTEGWGGTTFHAWSSSDMVNWTDEGVILDVADDNPGVNSKGVQIASSSWSDGNAWAPSIEERNGKYYFYYCGKIKSEYLDTYAIKNDDGSYNDKAIGVAVANNPAGPYTANDAPIVYPKMMSENLSSFSGQVIDPSVFTDNDGTSYLFFGNGNAAISTLNSDMLSIKTNSLKKINGMTDFRESVVVFKRNSTYYFTWSCDDTGSENYHIKYGTASKITTGSTSTKNISVTTTGVLMQKDTSKGILGTGHQSVLYLPNVDRLFLAYHRFYTPLGYYSSSGCHRETCIDEINFDSSNNLIVKAPTMEGLGYGVCPSGHNFSRSYYIAPTCTTGGSETLTCAKCFYEITYTENELSRLKAYDHQYYKTEHITSCEDDGYIQYKCNLCNDSYKTDIQSAYGHMFSCTDTKALTYECDKCGKEENKSPSELFGMWDIRFVNKEPNSTNVDDSSYFELNNDGIINAKDFAVVINAN